MDKDTLKAKLMRSLLLDTLDSEDRILLTVLLNYLNDLILTDREQDIKDKLPEIIEVAITNANSGTHPYSLKCREQYGKITGRQFLIPDDKEKIILLLRKITN